MTTAAPSAAVAAKIAEAKASGKPLVVIARSPSCTYCQALELKLKEDSAFTSRTDIVLYREDAEWGNNGALSWTGGGAAPIVRITQWDASGKITCDKTLNRPATISDIEAAVSVCNPSP